MHRSAAAILSLALALGAFPALAQTHAPSADEIIKSLTPNPNGVTRGIRLGTQSTAAPPAASPAPSVNLMVPFASGSAELSPDAMQTADALGQALSSPQLSQYRFRVEGHTDTMGTPDYNLELSKQRAEAVVSYLEQKYSIAPNRLEAEGVGEQHLLVPTPDETSEPRNRRVQVVNLGS